MYKWLFFKGNKLSPKSYYQTLARSYKSPSISLANSISIQLYFSYVLSFIMLEHKLCKDEFDNSVTKNENSDWTNNN